MTTPAKPILRLTIFSVLFFVVSLVFYWYAPQNLVSDNLLYIVPFFFLVHLFSRMTHYYMAKKGTVPSKLFYLASSGVKLLLFLFILILYGFLHREDVAPFFLSFLVFYILYTFLDVKHLLGNMST